ncbi:MAG: single-stranded DNA-binding protein [Planctomycetes bacterium]|nr:single-stranded DNA-binding protein [Planctomycetota bacterium]
MPLVQATQALVRDLAGLSFSAPVAFVYDPLDYAWDVHRAWLERYGRGRKEVLLVGMNPGPFGMVQTGVPFGEVEAVRSWLGLRGEIRRPAIEHPKRPVLGFACPRSEVSGRRLWGWAASRFVTPQRFARRFFVHNYCPLAFVAGSGANLTPDKLSRAETAPLFTACDRMLRQVVAALQPAWVVGVGAFAEQQARRALAGGPARIARIPHPSPASPAANRGWEALVDAAFGGLGIAV